MAPDIIKITSLKAGLLPEDLTVLDACAPMIPSDWLALLQAFGAGELNGRLSLFEPRHSKKAFWPFELGEGEMSKLQAPCEPIPLPWVGQGMLTLGKCDWGWVTTGMPGTRELRLHPSANRESHAEVFSSLDDLLKQFSLSPTRHVPYPAKAFFQSCLDRRAAGTRASCGSSLLVDTIQCMAPDEVFVSDYSLCFHFRDRETLIELGNYMLKEEGLVQLGIIFNPSMANSSVPFFSELNVLLRSEAPDSLLNGDKMQE
ncbi:MAG: hypothetical protein V4662_01935 [Verrucomicrobiota bacterium]